MTKEIFQLYEEYNKKKWSIEAMVLELIGEVGTLSDSILIKEGWKHRRENQKLDLEDDVVDIIFMLFCIADYYNIDVEKAYKKMIDITMNKLEDKLRNEKT